MVYKIEYSFGILIVMIVVINLMACGWILIGETIEGSWIKNQEYGLSAMHFNTDD